MKKIIPIVLVVLMVLSAYSLVSARISSKQEYDSLISQAKQLGEEGVVVKAAQLYDQALEINATPELYLAKAELYFNNEYYSSALSEGEDLVSRYPNSPDVYAFLLKVYLQENDIEEFFDLKKKADKKGVTSEEIQALYESVQYMYELGYSSFAEVKEYNNGFWAFSDGEMWGYLNSAGSRVIDAKYKTANSFVLSVAAVQEPDGSWYYIDENGDKTLAPGNDLKPEFLGVYTDLVAVKSAGKYGYYNGQFEYSFGSYDEAYTFNCGVAAVKQGNLWSVINTKGETVSSTKIDDIVTDEIGVAFRLDRGFVSVGGEYLMIDPQCNKIGENVFREAKAFTNDGIAAVKVGAKWGFVNTDNEMVIAPEYDDARSFSNGFAAVCKNGQWGYINADNKVCIPLQFDGALSFNAQHVSFIYENEEWISLTLMDTTK